MKFCLFILSFIFLLPVSVAKADNTDYLALLAEHSEIKAIAVVTDIITVSCNGDGTFKHITFKPIYGITPFLPKTFVAGCKTIEFRWQKVSPDMVYFNPHKGQKVYVTATTNGGAITSYTPINSQLETVLKQEPHRVAYSHGRANIIPSE